jgi:hypothetical protein
MTRPNVLLLRDLLSAPCNRICPSAPGDRCPLGHVEGTIVELSTCLQSTAKLSKTVSHLAAKGRLRRSQTVFVGLRCGQKW